jgi:hypothetical protein
MNHYGPMYETRDVTDWTGGQVAEWVVANPGWSGAQLASCSCEICGDVVELKRLTGYSKRQSAASASALAEGCQQCGKPQAHDGPGNQPPGPRLAPASAS